MASVPSERIAVWGAAFILQERLLLFSYIYFYFIVIAYANPHPPSSIVISTSTGGQLMIASLVTGRFFSRRRRAVLPAALIVVAISVVGQKVRQSPHCCNRLRCWSEGMIASPHLSPLHQRHMTIKRCGMEGCNYVYADVKEEKEEEEE